MRDVFQEKRETRTYDRETQEPVIHASICTGEKVAGAYAAQKVQLDRR